MSTHGGARNGAGRTPRSVRFAGQVAAAEGRIADMLPEIIDLALELARGVMVQEETRDGHKVYTKPPDYRAIAYLADRVMGKPTERVEHAGDEGGALKIHVIYADAVPEAEPDAEAVADPNAEPRLPDDHPDPAQAAPGPDAGDQ